MADCIILAEFFEPADNGMVKLTGYAQENSRQYFIGWDVTLDYSLNASQINAAIVAAVVAEFARADPPITIGPADRKILLSGAILG